jgi:hypothetical protein
MPLESDTAAIFGSTHVKLVIARRKEKLTNSSFLGKSKIFPKKQL